ALVALVGAAGERLSVDARPPAPALVCVAFSTGEAGTFTLRWADRRVPAGWTATLRDVVTGTVTDLATAEAYTFTSDATGWSDRFELSLANASTATEPAAAGAFALSAPSPNPASGVARLRLDAPRAGRVVAVLLDALGRTVATLLDADVSAGGVDVIVDASGLAPGTYAVRATGPDGTATQRLVVVR
ncbi:MAG TPA: T9SS type A sorting domain-containing protein, partial [Rubricoccaceae bacterium]